MEKGKMDHINDNMARLVGCTRNESDWRTQLLAKGFLYQRAWQTIKNTEHDTDSQIQAIYLHCLKSKDYDLLIQTLQNSYNENAAKILMEYYDTSSSTSSEGNKQLSDPKTGSKNDYEDFSVSQTGIVEIKCILENFPELEEDWMDVVPSKLKITGKSVGKLRSEKVSFGRLVSLTLKLWLQENGEEAKFKELVHIIEENFKNIPAKDALTKKWKDIRDA